MTLWQDLGAVFMYSGAALFLIGCVVAVVAR